MVLVAIYFSIIREKQHLGLRFAPFYLAFSSKTPCVLLLNARCFAAYCKVFCCILQCVLVHIAWLLAVNWRKIGVNYGFYSRKHIFLAFTCFAYFQVNKPSRESIFCDRLGTWWIKRHS